MKFDEVLNDIRSSFGGLWLTKQRGNSLEIITPYATTNNKFISLFITEQGDDFFITDGGWINSGMYDVLPKDEDTTYLKIFEHFKMSFDVKEIDSQGVTFYYVKANKYIDIPSRVLGFSTFVQNIVSISEIDFETKTEKETKHRFYSKATNYLKLYDQEEKLKFNKFLLDEKKELKFNAIFSNSAGSITLINYITGSTDSYFASNIFKTNTLFEMADSSKYKRHIKNKLSLIDNNAAGYLHRSTKGYLFHLKNHTGSEIIDWSEKERIKEFLS